VPALVALNNRFAAEVNAVDAAGFAALLGVAWHARMLEGAFLLALDGAAPTQGPNHGWWARRCAPRIDGRPIHRDGDAAADRAPAGVPFAYVDRVVVDGARQGQGLGRLLYEDLFAAARARGLAVVGCEVNLDPPNPGSMAFHVQLGFAPVGEAVDPRNGKLVRYLGRAP
jgi:uncharacterized protein